jgi:hypothetical protein
LALVQADIAAMLVEVENIEFHLLGFSLPLYGSGVLLATRPGWIGALVVTSGFALAVAVVTDESPVRGDTLSAVVVFMATASFVALMAHSRRWWSSWTGSATRTR